MVSKTTLWRQKNPDKAKALRDKQKPKTPEQSAASFQRTYPKNREKLIQRQREAYAANPEKHRARVLKWAKDNPQKNAELSRRRYARLRGVTVGPIDLDEIWERQRGWCPLCLHQVNRDEAQLDHIKPISKSGSHTQDNLQFVHATCNFKKGNKYVEPKHGPAS